MSDEEIESLIQLIIDNAEIVDLDTPEKLKKEWFDEEW